MSFYNHNIPELFTARIIIYIKFLAIVIWKEKRTQRLQQPDNICGFLAPVL